MIGRMLPLLLPLLNINRDWPESPPPDAIENYDGKNQRKSVVVERRPISRGEQRNQYQQNQNERTEGGDTTHDNNKNHLISNTCLQLTLPMAYYP